MFFYVLPLFIVLAGFAWPCPVAAADLDSIGQGGPSYHIQADFLNFDDVTRVFRGRGNASIVSGEESLRADAVEFSDQTKEVKAWGNVHFTSGRGWVTGSRIEMNLEEKTGVIYNGTLFIEKSHFYVKGDQIQKTGRASYYVKDNGRFTSCDGDSPAWEITGTDLKVTIEGYGSVKHAALRAKSVPVLYSPYMVFPAKMKRQTGLLMPLVMYSKTNGTQYIQPFFWAINDHSDATFTAHYMAHRGGKSSVEYRHVSSERSKSTAMYDFLYDEQIDDGSSAGDGGGYHYEGFRGDSENRLNRKRWWFRMKADWEMPAELNAKLDIDVVSDQDYLREFNTIYSGFEFTDAYFTREFGRELDDETDTVRLNQWNLNRTWDQFSLNAGLKWYDNIIVRNNNTEDTTQQSLPTITFSGSKQQVSESDLYYDLSTSFSHYWRDVGTRGYTMDLNPRAYYPLSIFEYFDFEPSLGLRETLWQVEASGSSGPGKEDQLRSREIADFRADLSTELSRIFNIEGEDVDKIRHSIRPQAVYTYIPDVEQGEVPDFVGTISEKNEVSYSVTNTFTARRVAQAKPEEILQREAEAWEAWASDSVSPVNDAAQDWGYAIPKFVYHEFCRLTLSQSYDIITARRPASGGNPRQPFSDVSARLELKPFYPYDVSFVGNATWSPYDGEYNYDTVTDLHLENKRGDWVSTTFRYVRDSSSNILAKAFVHLFSPLSVYWEHEHNLKDRKEIKSVLGFKYEPQCWSLNIEYTHDRPVNNRQYLFQISLHGLGKYDLGQYKPGATDKWYNKG